MRPLHIKLLNDQNHMTKLKIHGREMAKKRQRLVWSLGQLPRPQYGDTSVHRHKKT